MMHYDFDETEYNAEYSCAGEPLSAEEEIDLSRRILAGQAAVKALAQAERLAEADCAELLRTAEDGRAAYHRLVTANIPRAKKFAADAWKRNPYGLNELEDYIQTALMIICEAAMSYDWQHGCRFSTWAHKRLKQGMIRVNSIAAYPMRIPEDQLCKLVSLRRLKDELGLEKAAERLGMSRKAAAKLLMAATPCKSLQDPVNSDEPDCEWGELIADPRNPSTEDIEAGIDLKMGLRRLRNAMALLPEKQRRLLELRMGYTGRVYTLQELTGMYGKTTGSVQKRQLTAQKHLREIYDSLPLAG